MTKTIEDLFSSLSLFQKVEVNGDYGKAIEEFTEDGGSFDCYCPFCGQNSTFYHGRVDQRSSYKTRERTIAGTREYFTRSVSDFKAAVCSRDRSHIIELYYQLSLTEEDETSDLDKNNTSGSFLKVGQFPSQFEFADIIFKKFKNTLDQADLQDLRKAIVSSAHGYGASSFLYSRRVFERLIEKKRAEYEKEGKSIDKRARMDEKVIALSETLPDFLVANSQIYSILGTGVHELSDEQCVIYFPVILESVIAILEDEREASERDVRKNELQKKINKINSSLKNNSG